MALQFKNPQGLIIQLLINLTVERFDKFCFFR